MHMHERFANFFAPPFSVAFLLTAAAYVCLNAQAAESHATTSGARSFHSVYSKQNPLTRAALYDDRGLQFGRKGSWQKAIREYENALDEEPENPSYRTHLSVAHLSYGNVLSSKKKRSSAEDHYKKCLYLDPNNKQADRRLDECLRQAGKNPLDPDLRLALAKSADRDGHFDYAVHEYRKAATLLDNGPGYFRLGKELLKLGKEDDARTALKTALSKHWTEKQTDDKSECQSLLHNLMPRTQ